MHRQMLVDIITAPFIAKTFGLGMSYNSHLCPHYFYISEMQIRATHIEYNNTFVFRLYFRKIKNRTLILIAGVTDSFIRTCSTLWHFKHPAPSGTSSCIMFHYLCFRHSICPLPDIYSISCHHFWLCFAQGGKRLINRPTVRIISIDGHKIVRRRKR